MRDEFVGLIGVIVMTVVFVAIAVWLGFITGQMDAATVMCQSRGFQRAERIEGPKFVCVKVTEEREAP